MNELTSAVNIYDIPDYWVSIGLALSAIVLLSFFTAFIVGTGILLKKAFNRIVNGK